jgi:hypothetical protein
VSDVEQTCGKGLAERAPLVEAFAAFSAAMADLLEAHTGSVSDTEDGRREREAYTRLVEQYRSLAGAQRSLAEEMAGYRTLPMAEHNFDVLASVQQVAFVRLIAAEERLSQALGETFEGHRAMLDTPDEQGR